MSGGSGRGGRGIDPKVREAALEAARRHGIPVGDWLSDGLVGASPASEATPTADEPGETMAPMHSRRIAEALERLASRIESVEQRNSLAVVSLDRTVLGLASRLDDTEIGAREEALRMLAALGDVKGGQDALSIRLQRAEQSLTEAQNPAALKALDKQLGKLAQQVHEVDSRVGADTLTLRETLDAAQAKIAAAQVDAESRARDLAARFTEVTYGLAGAQAQAQAAAERAGAWKAKSRRHRCDSSAISPPRDPPSTRPRRR
jgi:localization factor PodJL